jgi:hypothetical protein
MLMRRRGRPAVPDVQLDQSAWVIAARSKHAELHLAEQAKISAPATACDSMLVLRHERGRLLLAEPSAPLVFDGSLCAGNNAEQADPVV